MLPRIVKVLVLIGSLILCTSSGFVNAEVSLSCYVCDSVEECASSRGTLRRCEANDAQACVVVFNASDVVVQRACSASVPANLSDYCSNSPERCLSCTSSGCNKVNSREQNARKLPETSFTCFRCTDADCEDIEEAECPKQDPHQCYFRFNEDLSIVDMGCVSLLTEQQIVEGIKAKELYLCEGANCNGYENIPQEKACIQCNSSENEKCATSPAVVNNPISCRKVPYTQCYERVNVAGGGITERGCLSELSGDDFYDCLTGASELCRICSERSCNDNVIPDNRPTCLLCSSETDSTCHHTPQAVSVCPIYDENDSCVAVYENGVTKRGCLSQLSCDSASRNCQICKGNSCNAADIKKRMEDVYGAFQELPLKCHTCSGADCLNAAETTETCEGDVYQDCVTVFDTSGAVVRRGCEAVVEAEYQTHCAQNPELCFNCKSNNCNTVTVATEYLECLSCDAAANIDCLLQPQSVSTTRKCVEGCLSALYTRKSNPKVQDFLRACFEDIESADRDECTPEKQCVRCTDQNKCNADILPAEGRLSCMFCEGADCEVPESQQCAGYLEGDQCYIYFDNVTHDAVRMGCKSDISPEILEAEVKNFYLCDGDNCNDYGNLPEINVCYVCDSSVDEQCATDPSQLTNPIRCSYYPNINCYTRITSEGHTRRGCTYELSTEDFVTCHDGEHESTCQVCTESRCNQNVYPSSRQRCHRCNSVDDPDCENAPDSSQACPLYSPEDTCVSKIENNVIRRGCGSELNCDGAAPDTCVSCTDNNCNTDVLLEDNIGNPGIFQELPLNCYNCDGSAECTSLGKINKCEGNIYQTCTTAFDSAGDVVARGCKDSLTEACQGNTCYQCKSNGCNVATSEADYIDCIYCDSQQNENCVNNVGAVTSTRKCHKGCMTALYLRSNGTNSQYEMLRTCLDDMDEDDRDQCLAGENAICKACTTANCNIDDVGERRSCYHCKGDDCQTPEVQPCSAFDQDDECSVEFDESRSVVALGCKSDYDPAELKLLITEKRLWLCNTDNCNIFDNLPASQSCALCSSLTDPSCAIDPTSVTSTTVCSRLPYTQCYTRILNSGHTERGCLQNIEGEDFLNCLNTVNATECFQCTGNNCNTQVHPENRRSCYICDSLSSADCDNSPQSSQICLLYSENEQCVTTLDADGITKRACSSQLTCDPSDHRYCQVCDDDNCNTSNLKRKSDGKPGLWQPLPLTCQQCDSEAECASTASQVTCTGNEYCMTVFGENGAVSRRGCSDAVESDLGAYCDANSDNCHNCNSNLCNSASSLTDYVECIYCDSENHADCALNPEKVTNRRKCNKHCMTAMYPIAGAGNTYALARSCLDDKDAADHQACLDGDDLCAACDEDECNVDLLAKSRLSCYACENESCEDASPAQCINYNPEDKCFTLFDSDNDIVRMGCVSDLDDDFIVDNSDRLLICGDGDNCNSYENIPQPTLCTSCNSHTDPNCAIEPTEVGNITECKTLPFTGCYTRVNSNDGSTVRGCVSSLPKTELLNCINGNLGYCDACAENLCNVEIFPADRRRCHRCNTKDDPSCETAPQAESVCPYYSGAEFCSTKLVSGNTYRGCSSDFQCDDTDKQYCRMCHNEDNCNVADLANNLIGWPGNWQTPPVNCYTCLGVDCHGEDLGLIRRCENNNLQNCVTVFAENGTVVQRGCSDTVYDSANGVYCDLNAEHCKFCKSSGCNSATSLDDFVDCLFCEGADDPKCITAVDSISRTRSCHQKCITGLYPRTDEVNPAYELTRSCLDDLDLDDREACEAGNLPYCKACEGPACNKDSIPDSRLSCYVCDGENCEDPQSQICTAFRENDQCFILFDRETHNAERLGCSSDLNTADINNNKRQLLLCDGENCNDFSILPTPTSCRVCNSIDQPDCAVKPSTTDGTVCSALPHTECYTHVDENGVTYRGCLSDTSDDLFEKCTNGTSETCEICADNNCNSAIYPPGRRSCHRCNSQEDPTCEDSPDSASICPIYNANDVCVTKVEQDHIFRGCSSDFSCDSSDKNACRLCDNDNCNTVNLLAGYIGDPGKWQTLPLNCLVCEGSECDSSAVLRKCENNNLQTCVTVFDENGIVQKRGCSDNVQATHEEYCEQYPDKCIGCKSNGCNDANSLSDFVDCFFCDSESSGTCSINFDSTTGRTRKCQKSCMVALYPRSSAENPAYELSRSCLDDMDLDDREKCAAGELEYCVACDSSRCNTASLPAERHECYKCVGDCEDATTQQCSAYQEGDQCYVLFDDANSIAAMGCRSEYEFNVTLELVKQKKMLLCDGKNCNGFETIPTPKTCTVCNSELDPRCATNPNLIEDTEKCTALPYTGCYVRVNERGHTTRGCISSLDSEDFYSCFTGNDDLCEACTEDVCNKLDVFPVNRMKCHQCSSSTDPLCSSSPNSNSVCPVYSPTDSCVTNLRNGITTRGCSSNFKCDNEDDKRTCRVCNTPGCNTVDLSKAGADGEPGRWQDVPITCYTCVGETACLNGGDLRVCEDNPYQNCMTVFNSDGVVIQRGCSEPVEEANENYCENAPDHCPRCNSNGCNVATSLADYVQCLYCDTDVNDNCVNDAASITTGRMCYKSCMTALYPKFEEENPAYGLSRSCLDDMDIDDREACESGNKEYCEACSTDNCNVVAIPEQRLSCNICTDDDCQDPHPKTCPTYRPNDKCYTRFDEQNSIVGMGCSSEFSNEDTYLMLLQKRLLLCDGDNCNTFEALPSSKVCRLCNSLTDRTCAVDPLNVVSGTTCSKLPYTDCYERVLPNGATERGCLSSLYDDEFLGCLNGTSSTCRSCKDNNCNTNIYPEDRLSCHICDSINDPKCESAPDSLSICPSYDAEDTCVTAYRVGVTYRGCSSSIECNEDPNSCVTCQGNGCNTINLAKKHDDNFGKWQDLPLSCYVCSEGDCSSIGTSQTSSLTCENNNLQDCVTVFDSDGIVTRRGCSDAIQADLSSYCDESDENCFYCKSNNCNSAENRITFIDCIYCDSNSNLECLFDPTSAAHNVRKCDGGCMTALYPSDDSSDPSYNLIRTCLNDKEESDRETCSSGSDEYCKACTTDKCNNDNVPENRLSCFICEGEDCEDPISKICPLYKPDDRCFAWYDDTNSISQLGCLSSFHNHNITEIIATKRVYVCNGNDCNSLDRLPTVTQCAVCDSNNDVNCAIDAKEIGTIQSCNSLPYTNCYTRAIMSDGSTARGCVADLPVDEFVNCVLGTDENCEICGEDGCNREIFPADRLQCYTCDSEQHADCESFPTRTQACPVLTDTESCGTALSNNVTIRGCKSLLYCDQNDHNTCRSCFGTACNSIDLRNRVDDGYHGVWQSLPLRCHTCVDDHCLNSLGPAYECQVNVEQDCATVFNANGDVKRRGCSDDVEDYEDLYCRLNPNLCFKCKSNECNSAWNISDYVNCAFCNSETDELCAINPENAGFATRACNKECMVAMKDSEVIRSCLDDKEILVQHVCRADEEGNECASCTDDQCNKFVYPTDRLRCHVCTGAACTGSISQYCRLYDTNDFCFAKFENGNPELLGCGSSQNSSVIEDWEAQNKLYRCQGNDCNDLALLPSGGTCLSCDSSKTPNCAQNPGQITSTETCQAPSSQCATWVNSAGHTLRGCLNKLSQDEQKTCESSSTCVICNSDGCNSEIFPSNRRRCHICSSADNDECKKEPTTDAQVCPIYADNDRCVAKREDKLVERGCETDFTCNADDKDNCEICDSDGCNTADLSGASSRAVVSLLLTVVVALVSTLGL